MRKFLTPVILGFLGISLSLTSCKKETEETPNNGSDYYPFEKGKYVLYNVDSIYWDDFLRAKLAYSCQLRYEVADTFTNAEGKLSYKIDVLYRQKNSDPFVPREVIYATPTENSVELNQKNLTFIKMVFPIAEDLSWNGNAKVPIHDQEFTAEFGNSNWLYQYKNVGKSFDPGNNMYLNTVTVNQIDDKLNDPDTDSTLYAYRNYGQEIYAAKVGLVYRERIYWVFQPKSPDGQSGGSGYRKGYEVVMRAIENN
mgnify:CR=1 FL=1